MLLNKSNRSRLLFNVSVPPVNAIFCPIDNEALVVKSCCSTYFSEPSDKVILLIDLFNVGLDVNESDGK